MPTVLTTRTWHLRNGITLSAYIGRSAPPLAAIAKFLSDALEYFKERRDQQHETVYTDGPPPMGWAMDEGRFYCDCQLAHTGDESGDFLPTATWTRTLARALSISITLVDIQKDMSSYRDNADGWLSDVVGLLSKSGGDLEAFELMLQREEDI